MYATVLHDFLKALPGELKITAKFPDGTVEITQFEDVKKAAAMPSTTCHRVLIWSPLPDGHNSTAEQLFGVLNRIKDRLLEPFLSPRQRYDTQSTAHL